MGITQTQSPNEPVQAQKQTQTQTQTNQESKPSYSPILPPICWTPQSELTAEVVVVPHPHWRHDFPRATASAATVASPNPTQLKLAFRSPDPASCAVPAVAA
jgi:hypothetical protein